MLGKKSLVQIVTEAGAIDPDLVNRASIRKTGGLSKERIRRKAPDERKRVKAVGGGKFEPVVQKDRKDMGQERSRSKREQQPEKERGSAALSAKEAQRKAYRERKAREAGKTQAKSADDLLKKKAPEKKPVSPDYKPREHSGYSRKERVALNRAGEKKLKGIMSDQERDKAKKKGETVGPQEIKRRVNKRMTN